MPGFALKQITLKVHGWLSGNVADVFGFMSIEKCEMPVSLSAHPFPHCNLLSEAGAAPLLLDRTFGG